jgi:hypothetical protein
MKKDVETHIRISNKERLMSKSQTRRTTDCRIKVLQNLVCYASRSSIVQI